MAHRVGGEVVKYDVGQKHLILLSASVVGSPSTGVAAAQLPRSEISDCYVAHSKKITKRTQTRVAAKAAILVFKEKCRPTPKCLRMTENAMNAGNGQAVRAHCGSTSKLFVVGHS